MKLRIKLTLICSQAFLAILIFRTYDYMMKVAGLGQCSLDHLLIVDSYPAQDTKNEVTDWTVSGGGPVATALVSLSKLGVECDFYGIIGDDVSGGNEFTPRNRLRLRLYRTIREWNTGNTDRHP